MKTLVAGALALAFAASPALGQSGAPPLDPVLEGQLERWLGAGDLIFDKVYTRQGRPTIRSASTPPPMAAAPASRCCA